MYIGQVALTTEQLCEKAHYKKSRKIKKKKIVNIQDDKKVDDGKRGTEGDRLCLNLTQWEKERGRGCPGNCKGGSWSRSHWRGYLHQIYTRDGLCHSHHNSLSFFFIFSFPPRLSFFVPYIKLYECQRPKEFDYNWSSQFSFFDGKMLKTLSIVREKSLVHHFPRRLWIFFFFSPATPQWYSRHHKIQGCIKHPQLSTIESVTIY